MSHPDYLDRLAVKIYSRYLYPGQPCTNVNPITITLLQHSPISHRLWQPTHSLPLPRLIPFRCVGYRQRLISDQINLTSHQVFNILRDPDSGIPKKIGRLIKLWLLRHFSGQLYTVLELTTTLTDLPLAPGDVVAVSSTDRQYITATILQ